MVTTLTWVLCVHQASWATWATWTSGSQSLTWVICVHQASWATTLLWAILGNLDLLVRLFDLGHLCAPNFLGNLRQFGHRGHNFDLGLVCAPSFLGNFGQRGHPGHNFDLGFVCAPSVLGNPGILVASLFWFNELLWATLSNLDIFWSLL